MSTAIEWTDETWNPVTGCTKVSPGCDHCYAETLTKRFEKRWGDFDTVRLRPERLDIPLRWRKPRRVFTCSMSDLFHRDVDDAYIAHVFGVMGAADRHTFQVLTKRSSRMRTLVQLWWGALGAAPSAPKPNVWLGVSVEDRKRLVRVGHLRQTPAAVRFLSCEPLLEDLGEIDLTGIHWVIVGGESGPGARPMHPNWVRNIREQCAWAEVPFFFKQWGAWVPVQDSFGSYQMRLVGKKLAGAFLDGREWREFPA